MNSNEAIVVFTALAQETRLNIFRLLVKNSESGLRPSEISDKLKIPRNTLSFHLSLLAQAKLCTYQKKGKMLIYKPNCNEVHAVMKFLQKDCVACAKKGLI